MNRKKQIRANFRNAVFERDKHTCRCCNTKGISRQDGETPNLDGKSAAFLDAHHITDRSEMPNGGYVEENGITVCDACHLKAEKFHSTSGESWKEGFHPDDLYVIIGSSKDEAWEASLSLSK